MILVGLTGGIGAGKSTVSALLAERGAVIIDADAIVHEVQRPGTPVYDAIVEHFGPDVVADDGTLDRPALAAIVFNDPDQLGVLNGIVHPAVGAEMAERMAREAGTDHVVVLDVPLLVESGRSDMAGILVVDVDPQVALERLVHQRGVSEADARARMGRQASREDRLAKADRVVDNGGTRDQLAAQVDEVWDWMRSLPPADGPALGADDRPAG